MKKISLSILAVIIILAILPLIGNKLIKESIDKRMEILKQNGVELINTKEVHSYLDTKLHYELVLSDANKFIHYLKQYSQKQLPAYTSSLLKGSIIGFDVEYSNIPFFTSIEGEIYPIVLASKLMSDIEKNDQEFYKHIQDFLSKKGILYHITYDMSDGKFSGYLKDIDEKHTLKNSSVIEIILDKVLFHGEGSLLAPTYVDTKAKTIFLKISDSNDELSLRSTNFNSIANFASQTTYLTSATMDSLSLKAKDDTKNSINLDIKQINLNVSANTQSEKGSFSSKLSFDEMQIDSNKLNLVLEHFNYDIAFLDVDKRAFERVRFLLSKQKFQLASIVSVRESIVDLLSKGLKISIVDFSFDNIDLDRKKLGELKLAAQLDLKADKKLKEKLIYSPNSIIKNIDLDLKIKLSKQIFIKLASIQPAIILTQSYAKQSGDSIVYELSLKDSKLSLNGQVLSK
jgi:hypothetical protein